MKVYIVEDIEILGHGVPACLYGSCPLVSSHIWRRVFIFNTIIWKQNCVIELGEVIASVRHVDACVGAASRFSVLEGSDEQTALRGAGI